MLQRSQSCGRANPWTRRQGCSSSQHVFHRFLLRARRRSQRMELNILVRSFASVLCMQGTPLSPESHARYDTAYLHA
ncbi:hypothetical protein OH76DRAFT_739047 [Lentinus brumalis]|uniref:Uncharacterized protein n=1 Tax=Lentinus brumalis TaxID=2498619 RepID=A0A371DS99_9APHY|nr:hypothetical protein OH76DRAFT_739047 [Polyporus brumalis]